MDDLIKILDDEGKQIILTCKNNDPIEMAKAKGLFARLKEEREKLKCMDEEIKIKFAFFINLLINLESIIFVWCNY